MLIQSKHSRYAPPLQTRLAAQGVNILPFDFYILNALRNGGDRSDRSERWGFCSGLIVNLVFCAVPDAFHHEQRRGFSMIRMIQIVRPTRPSALVRLVAFHSPADRGRLARSQALAARSLRWLPASSYVLFPRMARHLVLG